MHEMSSLLLRFRASVESCLAAAIGSRIFFTKSTASWFVITCLQPRWVAIKCSIQNEKFAPLCSPLTKIWSYFHWQSARDEDSSKVSFGRAKISTFQRPSLAKIRRSVLSSTVTCLISGCALRWTFKLLSPNARATASCPSTLGTSPVA
jgi:hypothetical protein